MLAVGRWRGRRADRDDDPQPSIGAIDVSLRTHMLDHLAGLGSGLVTVLRDPLMRGAMDVEVGDGHGRRLERPQAEWKLTLSAGVTEARAIGRCRRQRLTLY